MLESLDSLSDILVCPQTGKHLSRTQDGRFATQGLSTVYELSGTHPVLVDFDGSVLDREATLSGGASSVVARRRKNTLLLWLKRLVSPSPKKTLANISEFLEQLSRRDDPPRVLVIGGGSVGIGMSQLYEAPEVRLIAFDVYASPYVQFVADAHKVPLSDGSVDGVIIQAVMEHVLEPDKVSQEIYRVLSKDGVVYAETPFMQQVHEAAYDFTRFTDSGHRYLFRQFEVISSGALHGAADQLLRSIEYFFRSIFRSLIIGKVAKLMFFWLKYFDLFIAEPYQVDAASAVFFMGRKTSHPISAAEIIRYYKGAQ